MPKGKGKFVNHKGKHRSFTNPDELEHQRQREEKERQWRAERGEISSSEEEEEEEKKKGSDESSSEEETSSEEEEEEGKAKGVEGLIQVENPNRVQQKAKKLSTLNTELAAAAAASPSSSKPELSRREREELEKQRAAANYQRLHAKGKTEEARADLARLAIIKAQREEAAKKRADEAKMKEVEKQKKTQQTSKALGKKP